MGLRNNKGQFVKGHEDLTAEQKLKRARSLSERWKQRPDYIGDLVSKNPKIYNVWRSFMFTKKGKRAGHCKEWDDFRTFYNDVADSYKENMVFRRKDTREPYSKDNFTWVSTEDAGIMKTDVIITIGDLSLSIKQWSEVSGMSYFGIKCRYYKHGSEYTPEEIVYGKKKNRFSKEPKDITDSNVNIRAKASKMISSYKIKDRKNGIEVCDITIDWMISNILTQPCIYCGDKKRVGCDRIDNRKGHTMDNVVPCCIECNTARNNFFSFEEMKEIGNVIREIKRRRKVK